MDNEIFLRRIHNQTPSIVKVILLFKYSTSKSPLFIYIAGINKLLGMIIFSSNFVFSATSDNTNKIQGTKLLRYLTLFGLVLDQVSYPVYYAMCFLIYTIEFSFAVYLIRLVYKIRHKQYAGIAVNHFGKFCFYFNTLFSQHILEWLTFIIFSLAKNQLHISNELYPHYANKFPMLREQKAIFINCIYLILNIILFIFINCNTYYSFYVLNSSLFSNLSPMRYRHLIQGTVAIGCQIAYVFHYFEVLISGSKEALMAFKITMQIVLIVLLFFYYTFSIRKLEYRNTLGFLTKFILNYCFFSAVIDIFIGISNHQLKIVTVLIVIFTKLLISFLFTQLYYFLKNKKLMSYCTELLFHINEERSINDYLESGAFILSMLTQAKTEEQEQKQINELVTLILEHTKNCTSSYCKCKLINMLPHSTTNANEYKKILYKRIGYLIETTFIRCDLLKNFGTVFLLAEYYYICTNNAFLAYTIIQSYLAINRTKISLIEYIEFYSLQLEYVKSCYSRYHKSTAYVKFSTLFSEKFQKKEINKKILEYCDNFIKLVHIKEAIESTIKIDYDEIGDIKEISSKSLTMPMINEIIQLVIIQGALYVNLDKAFSYHLNKSLKIEYYYQMYLFYSLFDTKIPHSLKKSFRILDQNNPKTNITDDLLKLKFENYLRQYFQLKQKEYYIMIKCDKGFTISYFSSELSKFLNFNQSSIIGEPFYTIFPVEFRDVYKQSILQELLKQEYFFNAKNSYIFDSNGYSYVCDIRTAAFPHLSKYLSIICEVVLDFEKIDVNQSFILNGYYNLISLSKVLESKFFLSAELMKKCEIDILDLFEISRLFLQKQFEAFSKTIEKLKESFQGDTIKILGKWLFINKQIIDDSLDISKTKNKLIQCAKTMKHPMQAIQSEYLFIERKRLVVLHNIIKLLTRYSEIDLHDESYKRFSESFQHFQNKFNTSTIKSIQQAKEGNDLNFIIKIESRCLFNTPIYIFSFQLNHNIQPIEPETESNISYKDIYREKPLKDFQMDSTSPIIQSSFEFEQKHDELLQAQPTNSNSNIQTCLFASNTDKSTHPQHTYSEQNIIYTTMSKCFFSTSCLIGFLLFVFLFIYHKLFFERIRILIATISSNNLQRDLMNQLYSLHLSLISHLIAISSNKFSLDTYINITKNALNLLQVSFKSFSSSYMTYCITFGKEDNQLEVINPYLSILHDWNNYTYKSEYPSEINKFLFLGQRTVTEVFDKEAIYSDLTLLFQKNYLLAPNTLVKTTFAIFSFYILNNNSRFYKLIHFQLYNSLLIELNKDRWLYIWVTWMFELFAFLYYFCFFFFFFLILRRMNRDLFYMLVEMFLYSKRLKRDTLRSINGNGLLNQKIHLFCEVINNFNEETCLELQKKMREKATTIIIEQPMISSLQSQSQLVSQPNTTGGNLTNSTHQNISNKQMLDRNGASLLKRLNTSNKDPNHSSNNNINSQSNHNQNHVHNHQRNEKQIMITEKSSLWSTPEFTKYFRVKHLWSVLMIKIFTLISLLICMTFSIMRLTTANDYIHHIEIIQANIDYLPSKFTLALNIFNSIRASLFYDFSLLYLIGDYSNITADMTENQDLYDNTATHFPLTAQIQHQMGLQNTDPQYNLSILCGDDHFCREILLMQNSFCTDGIDLGMNTIFQKYFQMINDFKTGDYKNITIAELKKYFTDNNVNEVEQTIDFVIIKVQQMLYAAYKVDSEQLRIEAENFVYLMSFPTMFITFMINIIFILVIYLNISKRYNNFSKEVFKLNYALFNYSLSA